MLTQNKNISKLDLSNQNLSSIPKEIFELKNLKKLNLSNNKIKTIPKEISNLNRLENLDISNNLIQNFYAKVCELKKLKKLNLNNNKIRRIPSQIHQLKNLRTLSIANNRIEDFPIEIVSLVNLTKLNISKNPIEFFPNEILDLRSLKHLWLNNLILKEFPLTKILDNLKSLKAIYCFGNVDNNITIDKDYIELSQVKRNCLADIIQKIQNKKMNNTNNNGIQNLTKELNGKPKQTKNKIFISYSHNDDHWLEKVLTNLKVLKFDQDIDFEVWNDKRIRSGDNWKKEIEKALEESSIGILLVSTDFLASDFVQNNELPILLENAERKGTKILPLIVGHCRFKHHKMISQFQAINDPNNPLSDCSKADIEKILVKMTYDVEYYF